MDFDFAKEKELSQVFITHWFKRIFLDDWLMKLFALVITIALWLGVTGLQAPKTTRLRDVTLNLLVSNDLEITNTDRLVKEVDLVITGDKSKVEQLNPNNLVISMDLTDVEAGDRTLQITPQNITVDLPAGVKIDDIQPDKIVVTLEKVIEKDIPVRTETKGELAEGFEIYGTPKVLPVKVRVRGPESYVNLLNSVPTEEIDITGRKNDFTVQQVPINVSNSKISLVNSPTVAVTFRIGGKRVESLFFVPYKTESRSGRASVLLYGASAILENLLADEITVVEDKDADEGLRVILPESIRSQVEIRNVKFRE